MNQRNRICILGLCSLLILPACAPSSLSVGALPRAVECVAVLPLEVRYDPNASTELLSEYLALDLFRKGAQGVIGPLDVAQLFREANDPLPPSIDPYWARAIGTKLNVDAVIFGSFSRIPMFREGTKGIEEVNLNIDLYMLELKTGAVRWTYGIKTLVDADRFIMEMSRLSDDMTNQLLSERQTREPFGKSGCWQTPPKVVVAETTSAAAKPKAPPPLTTTQKEMLEALRSPAGIKFDSTIFEGRIQRLTKTAVTMVRDLAAALKSEDAPKAIHISSHLDSTEDSGEDLRLSKLRAESIKTYLVSFGIDAARINAEGFGGTQPIVPNLNPNSRKKNRRVEIMAVESSQ